MMPMNNPLLSLIQLVKSGGDPMTMLVNMAGVNPQAAQALQMVSGKNREQIYQMVQNMCKERGTSMEEVANAVGISMH